MQKIFSLALSFVSSACFGAGIADASCFLQLPQLSAGDVIVNATDWDLRIKLYDSTERYFIEVKPSAECLEPDGVLLGGNTLGDFYLDWTMSGRTVIVFPQLNFIHNGNHYRGSWDYPSIISPGTIIAEKLICNSVTDSFGAVTYFVSFSPDYSFDQEVLAWQARIDAVIIQRIHALSVAAAPTPVESMVDEVLESDEAANLLWFLATCDASLGFAGRPLTGNPDIDFLPDF